MRNFILYYTGSMQNTFKEGKWQFQGFRLSSRGARLVDRQISPDIGLFLRPQKRAKIPSETATKISRECCWQDIGEEGGELFSPYSVM